MARPHRYCPAGLPVHIIQRGNNRNLCFFEKADNVFFMYLLKEYSKRHRVSVHAWVLMSNHFHLLVTPEFDFSISKTMQDIGREYVRFINRKYERTGTLWEGRFRSCLVESETYLLTCQRYIELNPVRAGMVKDPGDYWWSSYHSSALGKPSSIWHPHDLYLSLGSGEVSRCWAYRELFQHELESVVIDEIRFATNKGLVFGSDHYKDQIEKRSFQPARLLKRGRKSIVAV